MIDTTNRPQLAQLAAWLDTMDRDVWNVNTERMNHIISDVPLLWDAMFEGIAPLDDAGEQALAEQSYAAEEAIRAALADARHDRVPTFERVQYDAHTDVIQRNDIHGAYAMDVIDWRAETAAWEATARAVTGYAPFTYLVMSSDQLGGDVYELCTEDPTA